ncbi:hypothetical protein A3K63_02265 [Candidatus Micrarchaeota archaeon RBG_16_49_10]|nr:MAG: hypothetical protein A3K63_02265 [Candidatus Micrarchaeota archaeon RBG_16_49_10]
MFEQMLNSVIQAYGLPGLFVIMIIQTVVAPISSEAVIAFAAAIGISILNVTLFGGLGLIAGAVIAFYISRFGGRPIAKRLIGEEHLDDIDKWVNKRGWKAILVTRLIPIIPFDLISYGSGLTSIQFRKYFIPTLIGAFPRTFILAVAGASVRELFKAVGVGIDAVFILGILGIIGLIILERAGVTDFFERFVMRKIREDLKRK